MEIIKFKDVDCVMADDMHPKGHVRNDTGKDLLVTMVFAHSTDLSGLTWPPEVGISTVDTPQNGAPQLDVLPKITLKSVMTDGNHTQGVANPTDMGYQCLIPAGQDLYLWVTKAATAAAYTTDFILLCNPV